MKYTLDEILIKLKGRDLFPESTARAKAFLEKLDAGVILSVFETVKGNGIENKGSTPFSGS